MDERKEEEEEEEEIFWSAACLNVRSSGVVKRLTWMRMKAETELQISPVRSFSPSFPSKIL